MEMERVKIFNEWIAPVTRNHIHDIMTKSYNKTLWTNTFNGTVLDIGCGDGSATVKVLKDYLPDSVDLWALDISDDMINSANFYYGNSGVHFIVSDVLDENVKLKERFDCIFSFYCLHTVTNQRKAVKNIYNMLKHNGHCLLSVISRNTFYEAFEKVAHRKKWSPYMENVEEHKLALHGLVNVASVYEKWLCDIGFGQVTVREETRKIVYDTWEKFEGLMQFTNPLFPNIPEHLRQEYMSDYRNEVMKIGLVKEIYDKTGEFAGIEETYFNLVVFAVKT